MINENETRSLAHHKDRAGREVLEPLGIGIPTILAATPDEVAVFAAAHAAEQFVVKPDSGSNSVGVQKVAKAELAELFRTRPDLLGTQIVQPAGDFTHPFPLEVQPYDPQSRADFDGWAKSDATKELRVYGFHSPQGTATFPVARAIKDGVDHWFFVDPESVPPRLRERTAAAMRRVADITAAAAVYGTVDYGYGKWGAQAPDWHAIELNGKAPYLIGYDKHAGVADKLRDLFAAQIAGVAA